jgi:hypothetical protein
MGIFHFAQKRFARRLAKEQLALIRILRAANPDLPRKELYKQALMRRTGYDAERAGSVVATAERGISWWPHERDLTFREVVHYLAVNEYGARSGSDEPGTSVDFRDIVNHVIPADL